MKVIYSTLVLAGITALAAAAAASALGVGFVPDGTAPAGCVLIAAGLALEEKALRGHRR